MSETREPSFEIGPKYDDVVSTRQNSASADELKHEKNFVAPTLASPATPENGLALRLSSIFAAWMLFVMAWVSAMGELVVLHLLMLIRLHYEGSYPD
jgi:hypothetical protein